MKSTEWKTYRTRFLVQAKQLSSALSFVDPLGRTHCGRRGDYLVESSDGVISIAPRQIFEDIYVPIAANEIPANEKSDGGKSERWNELGLGDNGTDDRKFVAFDVDKKRVAAATKHQRTAQEEKLCACPTARLNIRPHAIEELETEPIARRPATSSRELLRDEPVRVRRKMPQPASERTPSPRLGLM